MLIGTDYLVPDSQETVLMYCCGQVVCISLLIFWYMLYEWERVETFPRKREINKQISADHALNELKKISYSSKIGYSFSHSLFESHGLLMTQLNSIYRSILIPLTETSDTNVSCRSENYNCKSSSICLDKAASCSILLLKLRAIAHTYPFSPEVKEVCFSVLQHQTTTNNLSHPLIAKYWINFISDICYHYKSNIPIAPSYLTELMWQLINCDYAPQKEIEICLVNLSRSNYTVWENLLKNGLHNEVGERLERRFQYQNRGLQDKRYQDASTRKSANSANDYQANATIASSNIRKSFFSCQENLSTSANCTTNPSKYFSASSSNALIMSIKVLGTHLLINGKIFVSQNKNFLCYLFQVCFKSPSLKVRRYSQAVFIIYKGLVGSCEAKEVLEHLSRCIPFYFYKELCQAIE